MKRILRFEQVSIKNVAQVGGKNASLGEMINNLKKRGVPVPTGFAVTADAFRDFLKRTGIAKEVWSMVNAIDVTDQRELAEGGKKLRQLVASTPLPADLEAGIIDAYRELAKKTKQPYPVVAVRSSATAEDLPSASFAGQHDSYLNIRGEKAVLEAVSKCFASLFTDRAISYRVNNHFPHKKVAMSAGVQLMVRSDSGCAGVMFTIDTESGFERAVLIDSSWGYGEGVVQGKAIPDHFVVSKDRLATHRPIVERTRGSKLLKFVAKAGGSHIVPTTASERNVFSISDDEVLQLAKWAVEIEKLYKKPMDIEWAKDGPSKKLFIVQARPETVEARRNTDVIEEYSLGKRGKVLVSGIAVGHKIGSGKAKLIASPKQISKFRAGEVLVTKMTDPAWEPIMKIAGAIVTDGGGRTSHAAIVSRELGVPCIVGTGIATKTIKEGRPVTVSCAEGETGFVYDGAIPFKVRRTNVSKLPKPRIKVLMNIGQPDTAFGLSKLPADGVGLAREEFIIANSIGIHPNALLNLGKLKDRGAAQKIRRKIIGYKKPTDFYIEKLAEGIAKIGAAFWPNDVIVRFSDFKTNEYATLLGGKEFEPKEENPMIGWRGASRYYDPEFEAAFVLECEAMKMARDVKGFTNVVPMIPFCRTVEEGKKCLAVMAKTGLRRGKNGLRVYVMCEIPSNVILAEQFADIFDGFSIGSNDLTQCTLGLDRDSTRLHNVADERNEAVVTLIKHAIAVCREKKVKIGICGQAPSDYPEFAGMLMKAGIDSVSLNPDSILPTRIRLAKKKRR
jgi:pyruvate, water dikinase